MHGDTDPAADCELAVVVGGDGSILRAAEVTRETGTPLLGVNLGHVGFLAEAEVDDVEDVIDAIVARRWTPEDRLALDVRAFRDGELVTQTFALNEASVEKAARERMIEVVVEIDDRPLSRWGCDGVVLATPTGFDGLQLQRRRADRVAGRRGAAGGADQRARAVRPAAGGGARLGAGGRGASRGPTAPGCCGATGGGPSTCRRVPGSRYAVRTGRSGWPGCTRRRSPTGWWPSSTCRSQGWRGRPSAADAPRERG